MSRATAATRAAASNEARLLMKLLRHGSIGAEKPALLDRTGTIRDLSAHVEDFSGFWLHPEQLAKLEQLDHQALPVIAAPARLGPPVSKVGKIVCVGLNYHDHVKEAGASIPAEPVLFMKATTAICGPNDDVVLPRQSLKCDWEVELAVVIGAIARRVSSAAALDHVAGFCIANDVSDRAFQLERGGQWVKGKSFDTAAPLGPWLVTRSEIADPQALSIRLDVNGRAFQRSSTAHMIFPVDDIVSYISEFMTLMPGDVVLTGTPAGVGLGQSPPVYLKPGDVMSLAIEGLGQQRQTVRAAPADTASN